MPRRVAAWACVMSADWILSLIVRNSGWARSTFSSMPILGARAIRVFGKATRDRRPVAKAAGARWRVKMVDAHDNSIAVIGMAGRFPGAPDLATYWSNLTGGIESIRQVSEQDLRDAGVSAERIADPNYVRAYPAVEDATLFDARYFNLSAREVEYIDPQHRLFLECAVHALENAGCDPKRYAGNIGVFGGTNPNAYQFLALRHRILSGAFGSVSQIFESLESDLMFFLGGDKDYLATRVSYKLDLRGPSFSVQTACSTSLVAVHLACQSLLSGECEVALAGGVSATPGSYLKVGYVVSPGMTS